MGAGFPPKVPGDAVVSYEVELCEFEAPRNSTEECVKYALDKKELGNSFMAKSMWMDAIVLYLKGIVELEKPDVRNAPRTVEGTDTKVLQVSLLNNSALAMIKLGNFNDARQNLKLALDIDENNDKALYR